MFENEEKQLLEIKSKLEDIQIPNDQLNAAIQNGFLSADAELKAKRRKRRKSLWSIAVAAVVLLAFVTSIRVSPAFANAVASIPGMGKIVELIENDKGIKAIVENDYYQPIHVSQYQDDLTLTIDGVILDETGMIISYSLEAPYSLEEIMYEEISIYQDGKKIQPASMSYMYPDQKSKNRIEDVIDYVFLEKQTFSKQDFVLEIQLAHNNTDKTTSFSIPFTVPEEVAKGKVYAVNEVIEIEKQKMTIQEITIYPLRAEVKLAFDESNTMEVLHFEDMRIEDEDGKAWTKIQRGIVGLVHDETNQGQTYYLQSNYFEEPKEFYFKMNKIQALPKDETYLLVDLWKKKVLKQPADGKVEVAEMTSDSIEVRFPFGKDNFGYFLFSNTENADGEKVDYASQMVWKDEQFEYSRLVFEQNHYKNPLKINFYAYPNYINGDVSIKLE